MAQVKNCCSAHGWGKVTRCMCSTVSGPGASCLEADTRDSSRDVPGEVPPSLSPISLAGAWRCLVVVLFLHTPGRVNFECEEGRSAETVLLSVGSRRKHKRTRATRCHPTRRLPPLPAPRGSSGHQLGRNMGSWLIAATRRSRTNRSQSRTSGKEEKR